MLSIEDVVLEVEVDIFELLEPARLRELAIDIKDEVTEPLSEASCQKGTGKTRATHTFAGKTTHTKILSRAD